jgi:hypothetical protein
MQPNQSAPIEYNRIWVQRRLAYWLAIPAFLILLDLIFSLSTPADWIPGSPMRLAFLYGWLVLYFGRTHVRIDSTSFKLEPGPLPAGLLTQSHPKSAVKSLYRLRRPRYFGLGEKSAQYLAAVELNDGSRHFLDGPFANPDAADAALQKASIVWGYMPIDAPRKGNSADQDPAIIPVVKFWAILYAGTFAWGLIVNLVFF